MTKQKNFIYDKIIDIFIYEHHLNKLEIDGVEIHLIETINDLNFALKTLKKSEKLALDTEFDKFRYRYGFNICLLQIYDGYNCYIFDPLKIEIENLEPLWEIIEDKNILKVFQSCDEDIRLFKGYGCNPQNVFDNAVAASMLGYPKISLKAILKEKLDIEIDKSQQKSNWIKRPLTNSQIIYSAIDVIYLFKIMDILLDEVKKLNLEEELNLNNQKLLKLDENFVEQHLRKILKKVRMSDYEKYILKEIYYFRDSVARRYNIPPHFVFSDDILKSFARAPYDFIDNWYEEKGILRKLKNEHFIDLLYSMIKKAESSYRPKKRKRF